MYLEGERGEKCLTVRLTLVLQTVSGLNNVLDLFDIALLGQITVVLSLVLDSFSGRIRNEIVVVLIL